MKEEQLIFIISQPRAGSTYLQNLLSNNEQVNTCSEPWILLNYANQLNSTLVSATFNNDLAVEAFEAYKKKYPELGFDTKQKQFLLNLYAPMAKGFQFVIDKTPRYWELLDEISSLFPKSKLIIIKRHPLEVARSIITTWRMKNFSSLNLLRRDLLLAPQRLHEFCKSHDGHGQVYSLKYEDLIENTTEEVKKLYSWAGLKFTPEVLDVKKNKKYKGKFGDPYQNASIDYLKKKELVKDHELSNSFKEFIKGYAHFLGADFLKAYGDYEVEKGALKKTKAFSYFMHLGSKRALTFNVIEELKYCLREIYYRLFVRAS